MRGFGLAAVKGWVRVDFPAAMMTACIRFDGTMLEKAQNLRMSSFAVSLQDPELRVVDLDFVRPEELEGFFRREVSLWRDRLSWDVTPAVTAFRRALDSGGVMGKAVRCGSSTAAYGYFLIEAGRGVLTGLAVAPDWRGREVGPLLLRAMLDEIELRGVSRIESQFVSFDAPWLSECFSAEGFEGFVREFRFRTLARRLPFEPALPADAFVYRPWKSWNLTEAAQLMESAHRAGIDARMNELYRTSEGCRSLLTSVLRHKGCGAALVDASTVARDPRTDRAAGFALVTETSARSAHLAQLAVAPEYQGQGLGRRILARVVARLSEMRYQGLSLMVSRENRRALDLYRTMGFELALAFPAFSRDR
jgi:ribosomal protein S18 acetylase RimI-like enzyme